MWGEEFPDQEMCPLWYIGIFKDGKGDFAVFCMWDKKNGNFEQKSVLILYCVK